MLTVQLYGFYLTLNTVVYTLTPTPSHVWKTLGTASLLQEQIHCNCTAMLLLFTVRATQLTRQVYLVKVCCSNIGRVLYMINVQIKLLSSFKSLVENWELNSLDSVAPVSMLKFKPYSTLLITSYCALLRKDSLCAPVGCCAHGSY